MKRYISDLHFGGEELLTKFDNRKFSSVVEMNKHMVKQWNDTVKKGDMIIVLGDMFSTKDVKLINKILGQLSGKICLIEGNHDREWLKLEGVNLNRFEWIKPYADIVDKEYYVACSHYPMPIYNHQHLKKNGEYVGYMVYGHVHNSEEAEIVNNIGKYIRNQQTTDKNGFTNFVPCNMINCFCMNSDYKPLTIKEWIKITLR